MDAEGGGQPIEIPAHLERPWPAIPASMEADMEADMEAIKAAKKAGTLSEWEQAFAKDLLERWKRWGVEIRLSEKQLAVIRRIVDKRQAEA